MELYCKESALRGKKTLPSMLWAGESCAETVLRYWKLRNHSFCTWGNWLYGTAHQTK